jgi:hypothetical protein
VSSCTQHQWDASVKGATVNPSNEAVIAQTAATTPAAVLRRGYYREP